MTAPGHEDDARDALIVETLRAALPGLRHLVLYGSRARGDARPRSDLDLGFLADPSPGTVERFDLAERLAARVNLDVDLVDLASASDVMRMQIVAGGRVLFDDGSPEVAAFLDRVFSDYARLNEERTGILGDVHRRGSVHE